MSFRIKDKVWVQQSFLLPEAVLDSDDKTRRVLTSAAFKFTDTTIGGNFAINAPPQFTRFADIRVGGSDNLMYGSTNVPRGGVKWMRSTGTWFVEGNSPQSKYTTPSAGMGRFYSESIDDYGQDLIMRFGVPEYNSLTQFFANFYSTDAAMMARTGRTSNVFATAGKAFGFLLALPLQPIILGGQIIRFLGFWPASKYYYMKPTMYPYWSAVNTIVNGLAVNMGDENGGPAPGTSWWGSLRNMFQAERRDGAQFVTFRVSYSGSTGESFSSSVEESQISQKFNSTSSSARSARFDWANGADLKQIPGVSQVLGAVDSFLSNTLEGVHMSGFLALAGNAFVDIPKTWSGSTAQLPRAEYTVKLRSPYGSRMSRLMNLYIPLAMLLAGALPLSTGKRSYTSPFICEAFCRGRHAIRLGMIDSMSITRGVGNMGWNSDGDALGIDVTFSIVDMSTVMHMPINSNFGASDKIIQGAANIIGAATGNEQGWSEAAAYVQKATYDDDNAFTDYLAVLGSLSWQDLIYANRRWRLARYRQMQNWSSWKSPARVSSWMGHTTLGRVINALSVESDRSD